jgi:hypothetical protein
MIPCSRRRKARTHPGAVTRREKPFPLGRIHRRSLALHADLTAGPHRWASGIVAITVREFLARLRNRQPDSRCGRTALRNSGYRMFTKPLPGRVSSRCAASCNALRYRSGKLASPWLPVSNREAPRSSNFTLALNADCQRKRSLSIAKSRPVVGIVWNSRNVVDCVGKHG